MNNYYGIVVIMINDWMYRANDVPEEEEQEGAVRQRPQQEEQQQQAQQQQQQAEEVLLSGGFKGELQNGLSHQCVN